MGREWSEVMELGTWRVSRFWVVVRKEDGNYERSVSV